jgi:ATP-dependent DNA helicase RecQ
MAHENSSEAIHPTLLKKGEYSYYYYLKYYRKDTKVSDELEVSRKAVWEFKNGNLGSYVAEAISKDISLLNLSNPFSDWWLCVIPASTKEDNQRRFAKFCEEFCSNTGMNNGYSLITNKYDRKAAHLQEDRNTVNAIESVEINNVAGKRILLFDDLYTTGKSFLNMANALKANGAIEVVGLFLGKTHWKDDLEDFKKLIISKLRG